MMAARRTHMYAGLFLLPWVVLYGLTGALFNHQSLLADAQWQSVDTPLLGGDFLSRFPSPAAMAEQVAAELNRSDDDVSVTLMEDHDAEFTMNLMFDVVDQGLKRTVHIDPTDGTASIATHAERREKPKRLLADRSNLTLEPDPFDAARDAVQTVLTAAGIETDAKPKPLGWTKLNFLAEVNGEPARVTYVLRDGHVDVARFTGEDGMTLRGLLLRLHTSHGQPPHWNSRRVWSLFVDAMAVAMIAWAVTGLLMWWQIKRTRLIGTLVLVLSVVVATIMFFGMHNFYAKTVL